jgi:hypothetical protein
MEEKEKMYAPIEVSLSYINQKVASHYLVSGIPDGFDEIQYKNTVRKICYPTPGCKAKADEIFNSFGLRVYKIEDMFSVMLCDKNMVAKTMEDFSCNNTRVEVRSWKQTDPVPCDFEKDWSQIKREHCAD